MADPLRVLWIDLRRLPRTSDRPDPAGLVWVSATAAGDIGALLDADAAIQAVLLRTDAPLVALDVFDEPDSPLRRRAVLVWPEVDDAACDATLYAAGVQEVLTDVDVAGPLTRRIAAAVERKRVESAAARAYATDPLTGLVNRQQLVEHLSHLLAVREREPAPIGVIVLQVGLAKPLDDTGVTGTEITPLVRRKVGVRLRAGVRASDVVAAVDADTYAVMLSSVDSPADVKAVATKLAVSLRHPFTVSGQAVSVPVEAGWAVSPQDGTEPEPLIRRAAARSAPHGFKPRQAANDP
jgi:diguanylate cyclase (GGDEF)-like protein